MVRPADGPADDPALMAAETLEAVLERADDLDTMGHRLVDGLRRLGGARTAVLLQRVDGTPGQGERILRVSPDRSGGGGVEALWRALASSLPGGDGAPTLWDPSDPDLDPTVGRRLSRLGAGLSLGIPLVVGGDPVGTLLLLDLPGPEAVAALSGPLAPLASVAALILRNAELQDGRRAAIAERNIDLLHSEKRFRDLFERLPIGLYRATSRGRIIDANPALARMLGFPDPETLLDDARSRRHFDFLPEGSRSAAAAAGLDAQQAVVRLDRPDGTFLWARSVHQAVTDDSGRVRYFEGSLEDISRRRQSEALIGLRLKLARLAADRNLEELLVKSLDEVEALTQSRISFIHFVDADQRTLTLQAWSSRTVESFCTIQAKGVHYGIEKAGVWVDCLRERRPVIHNDYEALPSRKGLPPGHAPVVRELVVPVFRGEEVVAILGVGNKASDYTANDVETAVFCADVVWEIIERKRAEERLRLSEEKYAKAFQNSPVWVVITSLETGRYIEVNDTFLRAMEYAREDVIGRTAADLATWVDPEVRHRILEAVTAEGRVRNVEVRRKTRSGAVLTTLFSAEVIRVSGEACLLSVSLDISGRKRIEEHLRLSRKHLDTTLDSIGDAVIATDTRGRITRMNPMAERLTGWASVEALGRPLSEVFRVVHAHTRLPVDNPADKVLATGDMVELGNDTLLLARDGAEYQVADSGAPIRSGEGRIDGVVMVFRDVTESYAQGQKIRESEKLLKAVTANIPGVVYQFHAAGDGSLRLRFVSEKALDIFGIEADPNIFFDTFSRCIPGDERERFLASLRTAVETRSRWQYEGRFEKPRGGTLWFTSSALPHREGEAVVFNGVLADITERKEDQEEIHKRQQFLESVLYHLPDAIVTLDPEHRVIDWNPGAEKIFGYRPEEAIGRNLDDLVAAGRAAREAADKTRQVLSGRRVESFETVRYRKDGSPVNVIAAGSPITSGGVLRGVVAVYTDITALKGIEEERKHYEARIQQMQKMEAIGTLAGGIAHDFNNILSGVVGYAELSMVDPSCGDRTRGYMEHILAAAMRARDLIRQILTFSRHGEREFFPLQVAPLVNETLKLLRSSIPATIEMRRVIATDLDSVLADPTQIQQIVMNLVTNASQAMEEDGGTLTVELSQVVLTAENTRLRPGIRAGDYLRLRVRDTGVGIPEDIAEKIYNPYFTTKTREKGTGLGLSLVLGIVQSYGGFIEVESRPGRGSTFEVYIPTIQTPTAGEAPDDGGTPGGSERVLVVDDEETLTRVMGRMLELLGYRVTLFTSSEKALAAFRSRPGAFDLVVTDMTMPGLTGDRLASEIRKLRPDIPIVLVSGYHQRLTGCRPRDLGVSALLLKPIQQSELARAVRGALDAPPRSVGPPECDAVPEGERDTPGKERS